LPRRDGFRAAADRDFRCHPGQRAPIVGSARRARSTPVASDGQGREPQPARPTSWRLGSRQRSTRTAGPLRPLSWIQGLTGPSDQSAVWPTNSRSDSGWADGVQGRLHRLQASTGRPAERQQALCCLPLRLGPMRRPPAGWRGDQQTWHKTVSFLEG